MALSARSESDRSGVLAQLVAVVLLAGGVGVGTVSFLPAYLGGASLADQPDLAMAHGVILGGFALAALAAVALGQTSKAPGLPGALGLGVAAADLGLIVTDIGQAVSGSRAGSGLVLAVVEWALCAAGSVVALHPTLLQRKADERLSRSRSELFGGIALVAAGLGAAWFFAPAWDHYVVDLTAIGRVTSFNAGNAFAEPGPMIAGNVLVMVAVAAVAGVAGFLRQARLAGALLAGTLVVLVGEIASALVQWRIPLSPSQLGLTPSRASALGLRVDAGFTAAFYLFCLFVALLAVLGVARVAASRLPVRAAPGPSMPPYVAQGPPMWGGPAASSAWAFLPPSGAPVAPPGAFPVGGYFDASMASGAFRDQGPFFGMPAPGVEAPHPPAGPPTVAPADSGSSSGEGLEEGARAKGPGPKATASMSKEMTPRLPRRTPHY
jgi:hypothetical protein